MIKDIGTRPKLTTLAWGREIKLTSKAFASLNQKSLRSLVIVDPQAAKSGMPDAATLGKLMTDNPSLTAMVKIRKGCLATPKEEGKVKGVIETLNKQFPGRLNYSANRNQ